MLHAPTNLVWPRPEPNDNDIIEVYHSSITTTEQQRITEAFVDPDTRIRCVICTEGFGMGVNSKQVRDIILWGVPKDIITLWQQVGRCSRDGNHGECHMFLYPHASRNCDEHMKRFCDDIRSGKCIRKLILNHLFIDGMSQIELDNCNKGTTCCSNCDGKRIEDRD